MKFRFSKSLYSRRALLNAAYRFTDRAYIHLDADETSYLADVQMKPEAEPFDEREFENAMLAEMVRINVSDSTKEIRQIILARSLSSTLIDQDLKSTAVSASEEETSDKNETDEQEALDKIWKNWFDENENTVVE